MLLFSVVLFFRCSLDCLGLLTLPISQGPYILVIIALISPPILEHVMLIFQLL